MTASACNPQRPALACLAAALLLAACSAPAPTPAPISLVAMPVATATGLATITPTASVTPTPTETGTIPTNTPTDSDLQTKTPAPTATITPTPTRTRVRQAAPTRTPVPFTPTPGGARAPIGPAPDTSAHGVSASFHLESRTRMFNPDQKIWFRFTITNLTDQRLNYGYIGVAVDNGTFHTSWSGASIEPKGSLTWRDWVSVPTSGDYAVTLSMCFSDKVTCLGGGTWVNLSAPVGVTVR